MTVTAARQTRYIKSFSAWSSLVSESHSSCSVCTSSIIGNLTSSTGVERLSVMTSATGDIGDSRLFILINSDWDLDPERMRLVVLERDPIVRDCGSSGNKN